MNYLDSYSGSKFELFENENILFLRKYYKNFNKRDFKSFQKQNNFKNYYLDGFKVQSAKIIKINNTNKYIELKYYNGLSGSELLLAGDIKIHKILDNFLKKYVQNLLIHSKFEKFDKKIYLDKCHNIEKKIHSKHKFIFKKISKKIYSKIDGIKYNLRANCHGDFTLSNIIINLDYKKITLIDFLSTYKDSPFQDICKLVQDLRFYWSSRKFSETNMVRAKIFCNNIKPFDLIKNNSYSTIFEVEMLMTLLRILPYVPVKDHVTLKWLELSYKKINLNLCKNL